MSRSLMPQPAPDARRMAEPAAPWPTRASPAAWAWAWLGWA